MAGVYCDTRLRTVNGEKKKGPPTVALRADGGIRLKHQKQLDLSCGINLISAQANACGDIL